MNAPIKKEVFKLHQGVAEPPKEWELDIPPFDAGSVIDNLLEQCKKAEDAYEMHNIGGAPSFAIKLYRSCPGKTAIPFFHGATGPIVRGKVLFHGNRENPSIVSISCAAFRKWVNWFRSRPSIDEMKEENT